MDKVFFFLKSKTYRKIKKTIKYIRYKFSYKSEKQKILYRFNLQKVKSGEIELDEITFLKIELERKNSNYFLIRRIPILAHILAAKYLKGFIWMYSRLKYLEEGYYYDKFVLENLQLKEKLRSLENKYNLLMEKINKARIDWHGELKKLVEFFHFNRSTKNDKNNPIRMAQPANINAMIKLIFIPNGDINQEYKDSSILQYMKD